MRLSQLIGNRPFVIAEAGVNHNGSLERALAMVDAAAGAGADAVKFQTFRTEALVSRLAPKAPYQAQATGGGLQHEMLKALELSDDAHHALHARARECGVLFLSSPFDARSLEFLVRELDLQLLKLGSGEITNAPLLLQAGRSGKPVILSTGMSTLDEVRTALGVLAFGYLKLAETPGVTGFAEAAALPEGKNVLAGNVALLHCTSQYPAPVEDANLRAIGTLRDEFRLITGYSDHTSGIATALAAVALGARIVEKHFTLDRKLPGPDHAASLEPGELAQLVRGVREVDAALGNGRKVPAPSELSTLEVARRRLTAARAIRKGEIFSEENLAVKRPGDGVSPTRYWEWLGRTAVRDYAADERIE